MGVERTFLGAPLDRCGCRKLLQEKSLWSSRLETGINLGGEMRKKKVAITGIHNSGKTMFLTSLLWQLDEIEEAEFYLKGNIKISRFREVRSGVSRKDAFPFLHYRETMAREQRWPRKTTDIQRFRCQFDRSSEGWRKVVSRWSERFSQQSQQLDILDFPGERIADSAIAAYGDFGQWSDHMFDYFDNNPGYNDAGSRLRRLLEATNLETDAAVGVYRETLVSFIRDCKPLISPSIFLLDGKGGLLAPEQMESAAQERPCGLDANSQFVPLPESVRKVNPELTKKMRKHFKRYRKRVVQPLFDDLAKSDSLVILVDIPSLLLGGVQRYNDNRQIIWDLFEAIGEKRFQIFSSSLKRIAFVATKADLISHDNICKGTLKSLLKQMNMRATRLLPPDMEIEWFECSACRSTEGGGSENTLRGVPWMNNPDKKKMEYPVTSLPDYWPSDWNPQEYQFPDVYPCIPSNSQRPPKHKGLDRIFDFAVIGKGSQT